MAMRELTPKEKKRAEKFKALSAEYKEKGYEEKSLTATVLAANVWGIVRTLPFIALLLAAFTVNYHAGASRVTDSLFLSELLFIVSLVIGIVVHELIHGAVWGLFAENHFKAIEFGVIWKMLTPYCTCMDPLSKWKYIIGTAMPTIVLGIIPGIIAVSISSVPLCIFAAVMIFGGGGDLLIISKLLRYKTDKKDVVFCDHPYEVGLVVFEK